MKSDTPTTPRNLERARQRACLSSDSSEKISNYLNIWRIAVSSDRALPYPLKPREMRGGVRKDAAACTKVSPQAQRRKQLSKPAETDCRIAGDENSMFPPNTFVFRVSDMFKPNTHWPGDCSRNSARALCRGPVHLPRTADNQARFPAKGALTELVPAVFYCCKLLINK